MGRSTNQGVDKWIPKNKGLRAMGIAGWLYGAYESSNRIVESNYDFNVIASEAGGWTGAYMVGAMAGALAAGAIAMIAAPALVVISVVALATVAGSMFGYYLGSGQASKDFINWYNKK